MIGGGEGTIEGLFGRVGEIGRVARRRKDGEGGGRVIECERRGIDWLMDDTHDTDAVHRRKEICREERWRGVEIGIVENSCHVKSTDRSFKPSDSSCWGKR